MESARCKALIAAADCGSLSKAAEKLNPVEKVIEPDPALKERYGMLYDIFNDTYAALEKSYGQLAEYRRKYGV